MKKQLVACAFAMVLATGSAACAQGVAPSAHEAPRQETSAAASAADAELDGEALLASAEIADVTTVAYLGPEGTYTEEAVMCFFGNNDELLPQTTVAEALSMVADGTAAYAVVPQENSLGGPVTDYIDAFLATEGVSVVGEVQLPIRQTLMGLPGTDLSQVTRVVSHKQGLTQSAAWLDEHLPNAVREEAASTAAAAQAVAEGGDATTVAIAAPQAASLYKLEVLQENVSQSEANKTRFYVVSRSANELAGYDYAVFSASIAASELPDVLEQVRETGAELVCVHDRPEGSGLGVYRYLIELSRESGFADEDIALLESGGKLTYLGRFACVDG